MLKFAANISTLFPELPFMDRVDASADAGFDAVECVFPYEYDAAGLANRCRARGLEWVLINSPAGDFEAGERGTAALPGREDEFRTHIDQALETIRVLGGSFIHVMAGIAGDDVDLAACEATLIANLRRVAGEAADIGVSLLVEPISTLHMPGYVMRDFEIAERVIDAVDADNVGLQFDFYHTALMGLDPVQVLSRYRRLIRHVQIAGMPGRHEPDTGEVDFTPGLRVLDEHEYTGWIGCEYRPAGETLAGLGWLDAWKAGNKTGVGE